MFCAGNSVTGVMKTFWMSRGSKPRGSVVVFLASVEEARRMKEHRLVKIGCQIAFASEFQRSARPTRCYNCNQYRHYQPRCVNNTTCGKCSSDHRTVQCTTVRRSVQLVERLLQSLTQDKREKANLNRASRHLES